MAFWTHYWQRDTFLDSEANQPMDLDHIASNLFRLRGVAPGDEVFVISCFGGKFFVVGRIVVDSIVDQSTAVRALGPSLWVASDHILAKPGTVRRARFNRALPMDEVEKLQFISNAGVIYPKFLPSGLPDRQTFRGVRQISESSAAVLRRLS